MKARAERRLGSLSCILLVGTLSIAASQTRGQAADSGKAESQSASDSSPAASFYGRVVDWEGNPVAGAKVYAVEYLSGHIKYDGPDDVVATAPSRSPYRFSFPLGERRGWGSAVTDEEGRFEISGTYPGTYRVLAVHPERGIGVLGRCANPRGSRGALEVPLAKPTFFEGRLLGVKHKEGLSIRLWEPLFVTEEDGEPTISFGMNTLRPEVRLDNEGRFRVGPLYKGGAWRLEIHETDEHTELLDYPVYCAYGKTTTLELDLGGDEKIAGRVVGPNGEALAGVPIRLTAKPRTPGEVDLTASFGAVTNTDGVYEIGGVPEGDYDLSATRYALGPDGAIRDIVFGFHKKLHVPLVDPEQAVIKIDRFTAQVGDVAPEIDVTTRDGKPFKLSAERGKVVLLLFESPRYGFLGTTPFEIERLRQKYSADGRLTVVTINFKTNAAEYSSNLKSTETDWPVADLTPPEAESVALAYGVPWPPANFLIAPDGRLAAKRLSVEELDGKLAELLGSAGDHNAPTGASDAGVAGRLNVLRGRVLDCEGRPVSGAKVYAAHGDEGAIYYSSPNCVYKYARDGQRWSGFTDAFGQESGKTESDGQGRFEITVTRPGKYNLLAAHPERGVGAATTVKHLTADDDIEVRLAAPTFLEGRISKGNHNQAGYISLNAWTPELEGLLTEAASSSFMFNPRFRIAKDGTFRVGPLPKAWRWLLTVEQYVGNRGFTATLLRRTVEIEYGKTTTLQFDATTEQQVTGRALGPDGKPLEDVAVTLMEISNTTVPPIYGSITDADGVYTIGGVPKGRYRLEALRRLPLLGGG